MVADSLHGGGDSEMTVVLRAGAEGPDPIPVDRHHAALATEADDPANPGLEGVSARVGRGGIASGVIQYFYVLFSLI